MKCEIIRDLLPMYLDGLTSKESNMEIETHLEDCELCSKVLQQMQKEMETREETEKRNINPFRKFNRRMKGAVAAAVVICICFGGAGWKVFGRGFAVDPEKVIMDVHQEENMLYLDFTLLHSGSMHYATMYDNTSASIALRRALKLPFDESTKEFHWGIDLNVLEIGSGEKVTVAMNDGSLEVAKATDAENVTIQNGNAGSTAILMFREGDTAVSVTSADAQKALEGYVVSVDYGKETMTYTLEELLEMAE